MEKKPLEQIFGKKIEKEPLSDIFNPQSKMSRKEDILGDIKTIGTDLLASSESRQGNILESFSAFKAGEQSLPRTLGQSAGQLAGAGADAIGTAFKGAANILLPQQTEEAITEKISGVVQKTKLPELLQRYEKLKETNPVLARDIDALLGVGGLALEFAGLDVAKRGAGAVVDVAGDVAKRTADVSGNIVKPIASAGRTIADVASDITPTKATLRDRAVAKAFRLAPVEDLATIEQSTGNKVGEFMDRYDLIKNTAPESSDALSAFKRQNLNRVNDAIATVPDTYTYADIPELQSTVAFLKKDLAKRSSPEYKQVLERLNRIDETGQFNLMDAQYVKNVFDDIESVYKRTGEVRDAINAQDKAQTIAPVRRFIEDRVSEQYPNIDIRSINNNVQTTSAILDAIVKRAPKGDTASMLKLGDFAVIGLGNQLAPGTGFAALFGKKIIESAPMQLRMARFWAKKTKEELKGMSLEELKQADKEITEALKEAIGIGDTQTVSELTAVKNELKAQSKVSPKSQKVLPKSYEDTVPQTSKKVKGEIPSKLSEDTLKSIQRMAKGYDNEFSQKVSTIARTIGLDVRHGGAKSIDGIKRKAPEYGNDLKKIPDLNRSAFLVDSTKDIRATAERVVDEAKKQFGSTARIKYDLSPGKYQKVLVNVETPVGLGEMQITSKKLWNAKKNGGDALYRLSRNKATPKEVAELLTDRGNEIYSFVKKSPFRKAVKASNEGGFTYDVIRNVDFTGTPHIAVSPYPERSIMYKGATSVKYLADFLEKNIDLLQKKGYAMGGWYNKANKTTYLDVVVPVNKKYANLAEELGNKSNQIAGFDLEDFVEIKYKGTGTTDNVVSLEERQALVDKILEGLKDI